MHDTLLRHVDSRRLPGLVALISRRGAEHVDAIGTLAFDRTAPMRRDTIFRLASVTKPITAVATMILVEECKLRLDDPVDDFLPELANRKVLRTIDSELDDTVPAKRPITVRDLLTFRSGYGEVTFLSPTCPLQRALFDARLPLSAWMFPGTPDDFMQCLGRLPLANQPGERWLYHMSAEILGVLIARVSGMPLSAFMRTRIFEPLGMNDTGFTVPETQLDRVATCYKTDLSTGEITVLEEADARAEGSLAVLLELLGLAWLGPGLFDRDPARRCGRRARTLRLGRGIQHIVVRGPARGHGRYPHGAVPSRNVASAAGRARLLDVRLPGDR
jgi:CubicO group peptidase (beta-lactamase class C family)